QAPNRALTALGEDPEEYAGLMNSLENNLVEGLEDELKQRIGHAFWRMRRAERVQDGLALKRIKTAREIHKTATQPQLLRAHENLESYEEMATALRRRGNGPTPAEIQAFVRHFDDDPSEEMQEFFLLLKSLNKLEEGPERKAARRKARAQLRELEERYRRICVKFAEQLDEMQSPEDLAALTAPQDEKSLLVQRMEDSSLRQLWRLTNMLFRVRNGALTLRDVKNEDRPGYVYENKGDDDKMSSEKHDFLQENASIAP
ncbi:MAG: hypothetical protein ABSA59_17320, partial [Terriglobia bacterium]